jgi:predicted nucleotidyltransferase
MTDTREKISDILSELEDLHGMEVLFACEYGSRIWGLESATSDFDIRFIYKDPPERAFSLYDDREIITHTTHVSDENGCDVEVEISGWSLSKALKLAQVSNPQIKEYLHSPYRYRSEDVLTHTLEELEDRFSPLVMGHYYRGLGKKNHLREMVDTERMKIKPAIQAVRCLMMSRWIVRTEGRVVPPLRFQDLLEASAGHWSKYDRENLLPEIRDLVSLKTEMCQDYTRKHYPELMNWCLSEITALDRDVLDLPNTPIPGEYIERAFQKHYPFVFGLDEKTIAPEIA